MTDARPQPRHRTRLPLGGRLSRRISLAFLLTAAVPSAVADAVGIYFAIHALGLTQVEIASDPAP